MNVKITRNVMANKPVIKIGYCAAAALFAGMERAGYTSGVYGWNADVYDFGAAYIVTGYRFNGIRGNFASADIVRRFDAAADALKMRRWNDASYSFDAAAADAAALRSAFVTAVLEGAK